MTETLEDGRYAERLRRICRVHPRAYEKWTEETEEEDAILARLVRGGRQASEIAELLQRQPSAIRSRTNTPPGTPEAYEYQPAVYKDGSGDVNSDLIGKDGLYVYGIESGGLVTDGFDKNGNLVRRTSKSDSGDYTLYLYDCDNRLEKVRIYEDGLKIHEVQYTYDPLGNLVKRVADGSTTTYTVDIVRGLPVVLIEQTGTYTAKYTYGDDLLKMSRNGEYYYYYDGLGSTRTITDASGNVKCRYVYEPFGKLSAETIEDVTWNNFLFTGEAYDPATGLIYLRARYYDPGSGRFLTRDRFEGAKKDPLSLHKYAYCGNDPVNRTDPSGKQIAMAMVLEGSFLSTLLEGVTAGAVIKAGIIATGIVVCAVLVYELRQELTASVVFARKPDLGEIDHILKGLGITSKAVRELIHREISKWRHYTLEEIEEIAEEIGKLITKGSKPDPKGGEPENPDGGGEE